MHDVYPSLPILLDLPLGDLQALTFLPAFAPHQNIFYELYTTMNANELIDENCT